MSVLSAHCTDLLQWGLIGNRDLKMTNPTTVESKIMAELVSRENVIVGARNLGIPIVAMLQSCFRTANLFEICTIRAVRRHTVVSLGPVEMLNADVDLEKVVGRIAGDMAMFSSTHGIFPVSAMLNHGCMDTLDWATDSDVNVLQLTFIDADHVMRTALFTMRDVKAGEEAITSYTMPTNNGDASDTTDPMCGTFLDRPCVCRACRARDNGTRDPSPLSTQDLRVVWTTFHRWAMWRLLFHTDYGLALRNNPGVRASAFWQDQLQTFRERPLELQGLDPLRFMWLMNHVPKHALGQWDANAMSKCLWESMRTCSRDNASNSTIKSKLHVMMLLKQESTEGLENARITSKPIFNSEKELRKYGLLKTAELHYGVMTMRTNALIATNHPAQLILQMPLFGQGRDIWLAWQVYCSDTTT